MRSPAQILFLSILLHFLCHAPARAAQPDSRVSALFDALYHQNGAKMDALLQRYPALVKARQGGQTLLSTAIEDDGSRSIVALLLQRGANVNAKDSDGETPLHQAIESRNREVAMLLIRHGGRDETNPIFDVIARDDAAGLRRALNTLPPDMRKAELAGYSLDDGGTAQWPGQKPFRLIVISPWADITPLDAAVVWQRKNMVSLLLAKGAAINGEDRDGYAPLHTAVGLNDKKMVLMLLAKGADVNAKTIFQGIQTVRVIDELTPLHIAAQSCGPDMIALLTAHGANVNARDSDGETPLFYAIDRGNLKIVAALLNHGANPNAKNTQEDGTEGGGETPLHHAIIQEQQGDKPKMAFLPIMALLLAHGANVNAKDGRGFTPLGLAQGYDEEVAALLRRHGGRNFGHALFPDIVTTTIATPTDSPPSNPPATP